MNVQKTMLYDGVSQRLHSADGDTDKWLEQLAVKALAE